MTRHRIRLIYRRIPYLLLKCMYLRRVQTLVTNNLKSIENGVARINVNEPNDQTKSIYVQA